MTIDFMLFLKWLHDSKNINKNEMPIPKNLLKFYTKYIESTDNSLNFYIDKLENQYRQNDQLWYKWHSLRFSNISLAFIVLFHATLIMLKTHVLFYVRTVLLKGCVSEPNIPFIHFSLVLWLIY